MTFSCYKSFFDCLYKCLLNSTERPLPCSVFVTNAEWANCYDDGDVGDSG
ncbi:MAG: hypothetical protein HRT50_12575 [Colwellia sp.]|nr:hypothetical protein [Colwellia sp.]NQY49911.1 hypothetical protein [Colwellia sp.]